MIVVMVAGPGGDSLQGPEVLEHGIGPLGRGPHGGQQVVAGLLVRCRAGVLRGHEDADPGPLVPLVRQDRHRRPGRPVQGGQHVESGRGRVVGGAGLHRTGVHGEPRENPSPPARCPRRPRPRPECHRWRPVSGLRRGDPVGADQGPVQADERLFRSAQPVQDLGKVRGPVGDHPQGLMQIPVGRGPAHLRVAGQGGQGGARHHPPQQEHRPGPDRWPPWATASRHGPCGGRPTTGRWCGRWTREHPKWQDRTARGDPLVADSLVRTHYPGRPPRAPPPPPAQSLPHHRADPRQSGGFPGEKGSM